MSKHLQAIKAFKKALTAKGIKSELIKVNENWALAVHDARTVVACAIILSGFDKLPYRDIMILPHEDPDGFGKAIRYVMSRIQKIQERGEDDPIETKFLQEHDEDRSDPLESLEAFDRDWIPMDENACRWARRSLSFQKEQDEDQD
ncbi:MAG: hypothetical protein NZM04_01820 [Methylacidiphilales bacterium]|nr:hypothetical protein [Candidatus Methylacidiphilales bacterium]MDW8348877.1 hypothetical protein [Verrucomicrobiae bacterium]